MLPLTLQFIYHKLCLNFVINCWTVITRIELVVINALYTEEILCASDTCDMNNLLHYLLQN